MVSATAEAPYYATNGVNGVSVAPCTTQVGCDADTAPAICTTGADVTKLQCDTLAPGYSADANFMVSGEPSIQSFACVRCHVSILLSPYSLPSSSHIRYLTQPSLSLITPLFFSFRNHAQPQSRSRGLPCQHGGHESAGRRLHA